MECYVKMHEIQLWLLKWKNMQDIQSGKNAPLQNYHQFKPFQVAFFSFQLTCSGNPSTSHSSATPVKLPVHWPLHFLPISCHSLLIQLGLGDPLFQLFPCKYSTLLSLSTFRTLHNHRHHPSPEIFSSCKTGTLSLWNTGFPFPLLPAPGNQYCTFHLYDFSVHWILHVSGIMQHLPFYNWLISFSIIFPQLS